MNNYDFNSIYGYYFHSDMSKVNIIIGISINNCITIGNCYHQLDISATKLLAYTIDDDNKYWVINGKREKYFISPNILNIVKTDLAYLPSSVCL